MKFNEHTKRSLAKAISYRCVILVSDSIVIFAVTRRYDTTLVVIMFSNVASTLLYFFHERAWNKVHWGKSR